MAVRVGVGAGKMGRGWRLRYIAARCDAVVVVAIVGVVVVAVIEVVIAVVVGFIVAIVVVIVSSKFTSSGGCIVKDKVSLQSITMPPEHL